MINFIKRKCYLVLVAVCVVGFAAGYFLKLQPLDEVKAANDYNETDVSNEDYADIQRYTDVFSEGQYSCSYANGIVVVSLENNKSRSMGAVYTTNDILQLNEEIMNTEEPMIVTDTDDCSVTYEEYKNGYPTGALASYVFDENGNIIEAYFREGEIYAYPDSVISCEEAYDMAIAAVVDKMDKYDMAFEIDDISENSDDFEYEVFYCPTSKQLCYEVEEIAGHITNDAESEEIEVYFYVTVSLDGSYVEVASTLCY